MEASGGQRWLMKISAGSAGSALGIKGQRRSALANEGQRWLMKVSAESTKISEVSGD